MPAGLVAKNIKKQGHLVLEQFCICTNQNEFARIETEKKFYKLNFLSIQICWNNNGPILFAEIFQKNR